MDVLTNRFVSILIIWLYRRLNRQERFENSNCMGPSSQRSPNLYKVAKEFADKNEEDVCKRKTEGGPNAKLCIVNLHNNNVGREVSSWTNTYYLLLFLHVFLFLFPFFLEASGTFYNHLVLSGPYSHCQ